MKEDLNVNDDTCREPDGISPETQLQSEPKQENEELTDSVKDESEESEELVMNIDIQVSTGARQVAYVRSRVSFGGGPGGAVADLAPAIFQQLEGSLEAIKVQFQKSCPSKPTQTSHLANTSADVDDPAYPNFNFFPPRDT